MAQEVSNSQIQQIFKKVYGGLVNLIPKNDLIEALFPYSNVGAVGEEFIQAFIMGDEVGATWGGTQDEAFRINPAISGTTVQGSIKPTQFMLSSVLSNGFLSRSAQGGEKAFFKATQHVMKNHLESHAKLRSIEKIYGQSQFGLGTVSFAPTGTVYRGVEYSGSGDITLSRKGTTPIGFVDGVNTVEKAILFSPGQFASGFWIGKKGIIVEQVELSTNTVVARGSLVKVDAALGVIYVDFVPVAATGANSHAIMYDGWKDKKCMVGLEQIITNSETLFGIDARKFDLWNGQVIDLNQKRFNLQATQEGVSQAIDAGGLEGDIEVMVGNRTFAKMVTDQAALRKFDASYDSGEAKNGFEAITFYAANGACTIRSSNKIKEGQAFGIQKDKYVCSGSQAPSFKVMGGIGEEIIFPLQEQAGHMVRSFSDMYLICNSPATQILWTGLDSDGADYGN
jgi:hypothetical protein